MNEQSFEKTSYAAHEEWFIGHEQEYIRKLQDKNNLDYWREEHMYTQLMPLLETRHTWLTVGDGVGNDASWLESKGMDVTCSDISDSVLKIAKDQNFIKKFAKVNAEKMPFDDNSFDYALVKQAFHHFPRPYLALYEMIRVSKKAVVLIEPSDIGVMFPPIIALKNILDRINPLWISKIWKNRFSFEIVGNYVYKISEREMEKVAMGLNLETIAIKGFNDCFSSDFDFSQPISNVKALNILKRRIFWQDCLSFFSLKPYQHLSCILFKTKPSTLELASLRKSNYKIINLPENPYLNK